MHVFPSRAGARRRRWRRRSPDKLSDAIAKRGTGFIAVSGGSTPALLFAELSKAAIDWKKVIVTLIDERLVPPTSPRSNARLVADKLLQGPAAAARFVPLYHGTDDGEEAARPRQGARSRKLPWPLDVAVLGMGGGRPYGVVLPGCAGPRRAACRRRGEAGAACRGARVPANTG